MMDFKICLFINQHFNVLELKNGKCTEYIINWKSKGLYNSKLITLHVAFLPNVKYFSNKIGIHSLSYRTKQLHSKSCKCLHGL